MMRLAISILLLAVQAQAATLYVKPVTDAPIKVAFDSASTNDGVHVGSVSQALSNPFGDGKSQHFGGVVTDSIYLGDGLNIRTNDFTLEAWVNLDSLTDGNCIGGKARYGPGIGRYALSVLADGALTSIVQHNSGYIETISAAGIVSTGVWTHVALTWKRDLGITLYVNGVSNAFTSFQNYDDLVYEYPVRLGTYDNTIFPLKGNISDFRLWSVCRTPEELSSGRTNRLAGTEAGLIGYWKLDERQLDGLDWQYAYTNIQSAINASTNGDTVMVAPGTYTAAVTINKSQLTVQGGNGTLWDADRTIIDRQGALNSVGVDFSGSTNSILRGITVMGTRTYGVFGGSATNTIESCVMRGNLAGRTVRDVKRINSCIVVGNNNTVGYWGAPSVEGNYTEIKNSIVEANYPTQIGGDSAGFVTINSIYGNVGISSSLISLGGNVTNNTTNSVMRLLNIAPASDGVGTNLVWAGVGAYIPRVGSLAQNAGVCHSQQTNGITGDGGPAVIPVGGAYWGRDKTGNGREIAYSEQYAFSSALSPLPSLAGSTYIDKIAPFIGHPSVGTNRAFTIEGWFRLTSPDPVQINIFSRAAQLYKSDGLSYLCAVRGGKMSFWATSGGWLETASLGITGDTWYHLAWVFSGSNVVHYLNGIPRCTNACTITETGNLTTWIGGYDACPAGRPKAYVAEVRLWDNARSAADILANYTNISTGAESGLVAAYQLDDVGSPMTCGPFNIRNPTLQPSFMEAF